MTRDITASLEAEYEPEHTETDDRVVVGRSCEPGTSDDPLCESISDDIETEF